MRATTRIYVGNLPFSSDEDELTAIFSPYGVVVGVELIVKRDNGRPRGFAYVEMASRDEAAEAIREMDGAMLSGRALKVAPARPDSFDRSPCRANRN